MELLSQIISAVNGFVWGPWMLLFLVGTGVFLSVRLGFLQFPQLGYALKLAFGKSNFTRGGGHDGAEGDVSHFAALMTALAATIGTGNIVGVSTAVILGGPGAVFWMWVTAIFGMATKYGEAVLAVKFRVTDARGNMAGGPMYYIERGMKQKWLAVLFAFFGVMASFGIGNMSQSNAVAGNIQNAFGVDSWITGLILAVLTAIVILGGVKSIARASSFIVPFMALFYVVIGLFVIVANISLLPGALATIVTSAFSMKAGLAGLVGATIRYGVARGVFSNEAGLGSAPIAAAAARTDHPCRQALVSMTGTFLDTIVVCSVNGIILVMAGLYNGDAEAASLTSRSFDLFLPNVGVLVVTVSLVFFAYSTILGWSYYGERCLHYLAGHRLSVAYKVVFSVFILVGAMVKLDLAWDISDTFNGAMAIPNLIGLVALSGVIVSQTKEFKGIRASERRSA
ncbi:MAG: sodium:alanine symporter family protein [Clostridiales Family XIII bacterium]|jgi:AGCS family alanine or glycine:cation symporter|nr:sodium:alanine symporter family protein [Clostridiales Family XIII bacterium]